MDDNISEVLWGDVEDLTDFTDYIANCPTPGMPGITSIYDTTGMNELDDGLYLNDISPDTNPITDTVTVYNGSDVITDNTVVVDYNYATDGQIAYTDNNNNSSVAHYSQSTDYKNKRKRAVSFNDEDDDSDDDEDDDVSYTSTSKATKAQKNAKKSKSKCMSRNAIAARENREKKKQYVKDTERERDFFRKENISLRSEVKSMREQIELLKKENSYFNAIVQNIPAINSIIKHNATNPDIKLMGTSFGGKEEDKNRLTICGGEEKVAAMKKEKYCVDGNTRKSHRIASKMENPGICFHIKNNNSFTLELCSSCSDASNKLLKMTKK